VDLRSAPWNAYVATLKKSLSGELDGANEQVKSSTVQDIIRSSSSIAALVILQPLPVVDAALISPVQSRMVHAIASIHGNRANDRARREIFRTLRGRLITVNAEIAAVKLVPFVPFVGDLFGMSMAYALTWAVGELSDRYFRSGCTLDKAQMLERFDEAYRERYEQAYKEKRDEFRAMWRSPTVRRQIDQLKRARHDGRLTADEVERGTEELLKHGGFERCEPLAQWLIGNYNFDSSIIHKRESGGHMGSEVQQGNATSAAPPQESRQASEVTTADRTAADGCTEGSGRDVDQNDRQPGRSARRFSQMLQAPSVGAAITGTVVLGAATAFGVLETTVAAGAAYAAYRLFKKKRPHERGKEEGQ
jgi:uncharacterized protein (DUF697 family)